MNLKSLTAKMLEQRVQKEVDELNKRRRVIKAGLKRMAHRRAKKVFDALAAVIHEKHSARKAKKTQFNRERFEGVEFVARAFYTNEELDFCESWAEVSERRGPPATAEQLAIEKICQ